MKRTINVSLILLVLSLLSDEPLLAQSLFGTRGPIAQFGQGFQSQAPANSLSSLPVAGTWGGSLLGQADSQSGRMIGSGSSRFVGNSLAGQQTGTSLSGSSTSQPVANSGDTVVNPPDQAASTSRLGILQTRQRIAFRFQPLETKTILSNLTERFTKIAAQRPDLVRVVPQMTESGELLLSGDVDSEDSRRLAEILARLEPGVRTVDNRLTVLHPAE